MKKVSTYLGQWNAFEIIWLIVFSAVAVYITLISKDNLFGFTVFLSGILCVVLVAKGNILNYLIGTYNTVGYAWIAWQNGLFGEVAENLLFYLPMNVIGFLMWRKHMDNGTVAMRKLSAKWIVVLSGISVAGTIGAGFALSQLTAQNTPYIDAVTNVLSIVATILMMRRYREQWVAYIVLNVFSVIMWIFRTANGSSDGPLMIVMWSAYLVNAFYGFYKWSQGSQKPEAAV